MGAEPLVCVIVVNAHQPALILKKQCGLGAWVYTVVYASSTPSIRKNLWNHLLNSRKDVILLWLVLKDFNEIINLSEVHDGDFYPNRVERFL